MEASIGTTAARWVWHRRSEILSHLRSFYKWWKSEGGKKVLVLGAGGTGKTTLGRLLRGDYNLLLDTPAKYVESIGKETYELNDDPKVELVVPPGQQHRRDATWTSLLHDVAGGRYSGVIVICAYGYHSLGDISHRQHRLYQNDAEGFLSRYLEERRQDEAEVMKKLVPHIQSNRHRVWLLTLVTKQDLWWREKEAVQEHYSTGGYGSLLAELVRQKDPKMFRHDAIFACLAIMNFASGAGEMLQENTAGYDHRLQVESLRRVLETIDGLKNWELD